MTATKTATKGASGGVNVTTTREGWRDVSYVETTYTTNLCNGLACFQPKADCLQNLTRNGKASLRNAAGTASARESARMSEGHLRTTVLIRFDDD